MATVRNRRRAVIAGTAAVALLAVGVGTGVAQAGEQGVRRVMFGNIEVSCVDGWVKLKPWVITNQRGTAVLTEDGLLHVDHELDVLTDIGEGLVRLSDDVGAAGQTTAVTWTLHMAIDGRDYTADEVVIEPDECG